MKDAKKMSAHGKGQKFNETQEDPPFDGPYSKAGEVKKDRYGNIIKDKNIAKHLAKKGRAEVEKTTDKKVKEAVITSGPNKGKEWSQKTMGPTNPAFKKKAPDPRFYNPDGESAPPTKSKPVKKAEVDTDTTVAATDDQEITASMKRNGKQVDETKKETYTINGKKCTKAEYDAEMKKAGKKPSKKVDEEKGDGNLANNAKPYDKVTRGDVIAGRLGKDEMGGKKKKVKESTEAQLLRIAKQAMDTVKALREAKQEAARIKHMPISESDEYFAGLQSRLNKQIKG
jgi:hypothetical protein